LLIFREVEALLGTLVNTLTIILGSLLGMGIKHFLAKGTDEKSGLRYQDIIMQGIGLAVIVIGLTGALEVFQSDSTEDILCVIISLAVGGVLGELIDIEKRLNKLGEILQGKAPTTSDNPTFIKGFVTASLVFCVGAMAIMGAIQSGINQNHQILFSKSTLDGITSIAFASSMGSGVIFSAFSVLIYQGGITLLATSIEPYLNAAVVGQMSAIGGLLILGIGLNMLKITTIKIGNLLPAVFLPILYYILTLVIF
jgi:uncharacterized membrane protein YqgA involved in biofilm formation